jgi:hypothetical protein
MESVLASNHHAGTELAALSQCGTMLNLSNQDPVCSWGSRHFCSTNYAAQVGETAAAYSSASTQSQSGLGLVLGHKVRTPLSV